MPIKKGDKVKVEYTGKLDDGTVFDSSEKQGKPLEFKAGEGLVIKGFDEALIGMEKGDEKKINLKPDEAYGEYKEELLKKVPKEQLPKEQDPKEGMVLMVGLPNGSQFPAKITSVGDSDVTLDLNHPLSGKNLNFDLKVVDYSSA